MARFLGKKTLVKSCRSKAHLFTIDLKIDRKVQSIEKIDRKLQLIEKFDRKLQSIEKYNRMKNHVTINVASYTVSLSCSWLYSVSIHIVSLYISVATR